MEQDSDPGSPSPARRFRTPALDLWRQELRQGIRTTTTLDDLWRAACAEMTALEAHHDGLPEAARRDRRRARLIVRSAVTGAAS